MIVSGFPGVEFEKRDVKITDNTGGIVFEQRDVLAPVSWSDNAVAIVAKMYFAEINGKRENSVADLINRVIDKILDWSQDGKSQYLFDVRDAERLRVAIAKQRLTFNSPVWFNLGVPNRLQQASACFINGIEDNIESISDCMKREMQIFKLGSGSGMNMSMLRHKDAKLSQGGVSSGPISFMRGFDANAGTIKSGGKTRRSAKMITFDVDHPDILEFIECKAKEEEKARILVDAGYEAGMDGEAYKSVYFQNANHSIRLTKEFMDAYKEGRSYALLDHEEQAVGYLDARMVMHKIAEAAHRSADPGVQFIEHIERYNPTTNPINSTNPCSEYIFVDDSACNLASLNLVRYLEDDNRFNINDFVKDITALMRAQDTIVGHADYPHLKIKKTSLRYRSIGIGFSNLGGLLMLLGIPYGSPASIDIVSAITSLMTAAAFDASIELSKKGNLQHRFPYSELDRFKYVLKLFRSNHLGLMQANVSGTPLKNLSEVKLEAQELWKEIDESEHLPRNFYVTNIAPAGTISFMMDCATTGCEPELALKKQKTLSGGGTMDLPNPLVEKALKRLNLKSIEYDKEIFRTALPPNDDPEFYLSADQHLNIVEAIQPFISGGISKTINLPASATVEDIKKVYLDAYARGIKCVSVYRDKTKLGGQPLSTTTSITKTDVAEEGDTLIAVTPGLEPAVTWTTPPPEAQKTLKEMFPTTGQLTITQDNGRDPLPKTRKASTTKFRVGNFKGYLTRGYYNDGRLGEIFINMERPGSSLTGLLSCWSIMASMALQNGLPLETIIKKFKGTDFEPSGFTGDEEIPTAYSIIDYVMRFLEKHELKVEVVAPQGKFCATCGSLMNQTASHCWSCGNCGYNEGCS